MKCRKLLTENPILNKILSTVLSKMLNTILISSVNIIEQVNLRLKSTLKTQQMDL